MQNDERYWRCLIEGVSEDGSVTEKTRRQTIPICWPKSNKSKKMRAIKFNRLGRETYSLTAY